MVRVGLVGLGFMGMIHYLAHRKGSATKVVALCAPEEHRLAGDWTDIKGNFGPPGTKMDLSEHAKYREIDELLADPNVELVDLCVPTDLHAPMAVKALEAGKHVICEKPISLKIEDADRMLAAARASGKLLMVAQVLPFFSEFAYALEAVRSGRYGRLLAANLTRVICPPTWSPALMDLARSGGPAVDLHIHDTHYVCVLAGVPRAVRSVGVLEPGGVVHVSTQYLYDDPQAPAVSAISGWISQPGRPFGHGFDIYLERATLAFSSFDYTTAGAAVTPLTVVHADGTVERPDLGEGDAVDPFAAELTAAAEAVRTGNVPPQLSAELARQALALSWAEVASAQERREVVIT